MPERVNNSDKYQIIDFHPLAPWFLQKNFPQDPKIIKDVDIKKYNFI